MISHDNEACCSFVLLENKRIGGRLTMSAEERTHQNMDPEQATLEENFRYVLLHVGTKLNASNRNGLRFVHNVEVPSSEVDPGISMLEELMRRGMFDCRSPEKLQEMLIKIGRKDLSNLVKDYKKSSLFKQVQKKEAEKESSQGSERVSPQGTPERRRRDALPTAYTLASQLCDHATTLKEAIRKAMMEGEDSMKTGKALVAVTEAHEKLERFNESLKKALLSAGLERGKEPGEYVFQGTPKKKKQPMLVPLHMFHRKRAQSCENGLNDNTIVSSTSKPSTLPLGSNKTIRYKPKAMTPNPGRLELARDEEDQASGNENSYAGSGSLDSKQGALTRELKEGMKVWERRVSESSQCTTTEDSGYDDPSWDTKLPAQLDQEQPKEMQEEGSWYVNIDDFSRKTHSQDDNYAQLTTTTRNSHHEYLVYGSRKTAMGTAVHHDKSPTT